jgi:hypothetical protein
MDMENKMLREIAEVNSKMMKGYDTLSQINEVEIGLTPKTSQTSLSHDGNRIYLMASDSPNIMNALKQTIARDKNYNPNYMVVLEIDPTGLEFYIDPNFDDKPNYTALFTFQNISPDKIRIL